MLTQFQFAFAPATQGRAGFELNHRSRGHGDRPLGAATGAFERELVELVRKLFDLTLSLAFGGARPFGTRGHAAQLYAALRVRARRL